MMPLVSSMVSIRDIYGYSWMENTFQLVTYKQKSLMVVSGKYILVQAVVAQRDHDVVVRDDWILNSMTPSTPNKMGHATPSPWHRPWRDL